MSFEATGLKGPNIPALTRKGANQATRGYTWAAATVQPERRIEGSSSSDKNVCLQKSKYFGFNLTTGLT